MGIRKRACTEVSRIMGASPKKVLSEVMIIGRKRLLPASLTAPNRSMPLVRLLLARTIRISESLTTTPVRATIPIMLISESS